MIDLSLETHWENLLIWLESLGMKVVPDELLVECKARPGAGYGLFATRPCPPSIPLFRVPARALVNIKTLAPHYPPRASLTAVQLVSLHLFLHRPGENGMSSDPLFGPYISILPRGFDCHPLTWLIKCEMRLSERSESQLLEILPPSVSFSLRKVGERFWKDWQRIREFAEEHPEITERVRKLQHPGVIAPVQAPDTTLTMEFLWSWLAVNTRCIYQRLKPLRSDADNLTLCPILDFANHTSITPHIVPQASNAEIWDIAPRPKLGDDFTLLPFGNMTIRKGEEICLNYGAHSQRTLFVEYGFTEEHTGSRFNGEVDVQDVIEELFKRRGVSGEWMKGILEEEGYWGDWTLHSHPPPASPSYRLITALRLYHVLPTSVSTVPLFQKEVLRLWRDTVAGKRECISEENEDSWKGTLAAICEILIERAENRTRHTIDDDDGTWVGWMSRNITSLWNEEIHVAKAVAQSIRNGERLY